MADLKDRWKDTGKGLGFAFRDLGKTLIHTAMEATGELDKLVNPEDHDKKQDSEKPADSE